METMTDLCFVSMIFLVITNLWTLAELHRSAKEHKESINNLEHEMFRLQERQGECLLHCRYDISRKNGLDFSKNESVMEIKPR